MSLVIFMVMKLVMEIVELIDRRCFVVNGFIFVSVVRRVVL